MKKTFSKLAALFFMIMLVFVGCSNSSQITFTDENSGYTKNGLSVLTMSVGSVSQTTRSINPGDWSETMKENLMYRISGIPKNTGDTATVKFDENNSIFEYSGKKLMKGAEAASIELDPIDWKFTLIAYEKNTKGETNIEKIIKEKPVLIANAEADLTSGSKDVVFNFVTYNKEMAADVPDDFFGTEKNTTSTGKVDIEFKFETPDNAESIPDKVTFTIDGKTSSLTGDKIANDGDATKKKVHYTTGGSEEGDPVNLAPGRYDFKASFTNNNKVVLTYLDTVLVDAGNTSKAFVYIPKDAFKKAPAKPSDLKVETFFAPDPAKSKIVINEAKKSYAQAVNKVEEIKDNKYNAVFSWNDNSTNETSFILTFNADGKSIKVTYDCAKGTATAAPTTYTVVSTTSAPAINNVSKKSITMAIPTGVQIANAEIAAYNEFSATDAGEASGSPIAGPVGKFTIAYKINDANGHGNAFVKYGKAPTDIVKPVAPAPDPDPNSKEYFVMAYDFVPETPAVLPKLMGKASYPYIGTDSEACTFCDWNLVETTTAPEGTTSTTTKKVSTYAEVPEAKQNTNITLIPSWFSTSTILVTFPTYSKYEDLLPVTDQNTDKTIKPEKDKDGKYKLSFTLPTYGDANITDVQFQIFDETSNANEIFNFGITPAVTGLAGVTADDTALNLDISTWKPAGGIYTIYVKYNYQEKTPDTEPKKPIIPVSGCFYLEINNNMDYTPTVKPAPAP